MNFSHKATLSGCYACLLCDLLLIPSWVGTCTHTPMFVNKTISKNQVHVGCRFKRVQQYCLAYESAQYYFRNAEKYCYLSQFYAKTVQKCIPGNDMNFIIKFL